MGGSHVDISIGDGPLKEISGIPDEHLIEGLENQGLKGDAPDPPDLDGLPEDED